MDNDFVLFLNNKKLSKATINRYSDIVQYIFKNYKINLLTCNEISDLQKEINKIENQMNFKNANKKGHEMYNIALKYYMEYKQNKIKYYYSEMEKDFFYDGEKITEERIISKRSKKNRDKCIDFFKKKNNGELKCEICGFNFSKKYNLEYDFIEIHHLTKLSTINSTKINPEIDLLPVCSNCHSIIHKKQVPYTPQEIKNFLSKSN